MKAQQMLLLAPSVPHDLAAMTYIPTRSPLDLANMLYADPYALLGFRHFWESSDNRLNIYIEGRNLLNTNYAATYNVVPDAAGRDGNYFYPGEGRAIYAGFRWKL